MKASHDCSVPGQGTDNRMKKGKPAERLTVRASHKLFGHANKALNHLPRHLCEVLAGTVSRALSPAIDSIPVQLAVEPTNACNLRCPLCPTAQVMTRKKGFMKHEDFKAIVDDVAGFTRRITLSFAGEPLLCPDVFKMVHYAESRGVGVYVDTNGTLDRAQEIISSGLSAIDISLDGATRESYEQYRVGASFEKVTANIRKLSRARRDAGSEKPEIIIQFVVFKHNEDEVAAVEKLSRELGADTLILKTAALNTSALGLDQQETSEKYLPRDSRYGRFASQGSAASAKAYRMCEWAFSGVILYNGDVTTCCYDHDGINSVGNVFTDGGFRKVWNSPKYRAMRRDVLRRRLPLCGTCSFAGDMTIARIDL